MIYYILNGKVVITNLILGLIKKRLLDKMSHILPYRHIKNKIEVELDLSNYVAKIDLKTQQVLIHHNLLKRWFS